jgi:hypothetical protein
LSANDIDVGSSGFTLLFNQPAYLAGRPSILNGKSRRLLSGILLVFIRFWATATPERPALQLDDQDFAIGQNVISGRVLRCAVKTSP